MMTNTQHASTSRPSRAEHQSHRESVQPSSSSSVRSQTAFVRTLLDELERALPASSREAVSRQLVEEVARLGCRCLEIASTLTQAIDEEESTREGEGDPPQQ